MYACIKMCLGLAEITLCVGLKSFSLLITSMSKSVQEESVYISCCKSNETCFVCTSPRLSFHLSILMGFKRCVRAFVSAGEACGNYLCVCVCVCGYMIRLLFVAKKKYKRGCSGSESSTSGAIGLR